MISNRTLSPEYIRALYENRTDLIVSQETRAGDWHAEVTPNDGFEDGVIVQSNTVTITGVADLVLTKADTPDPVQNGSRLNYTITLTNIGESSRE